MGGSLGAVAVNEAVRAVLPELLKDFQVIHLCGKGKTDKSLNNVTGYVQYEFIKKNFAIFLLLQISLYPVQVPMPYVKFSHSANRIF